MFKQTFKSSGDVILPIAKKKKSYLLQNYNLRSLKQEKRRAKRKWLKKKNDDNELNYRKRKNIYYETLRSTKSEYFNSLIRVNKNGPKALYGVVNKLSGDEELRKLPTATSDESLAAEIAVFFDEKIRSIREETSSKRQYQGIVDGGPRVNEEQYKLTTLTKDFRK